MLPKSKAEKKNQLLRRLARLHISLQRHCNEKRIGDKRGRHRQEAMGQFCSALHCSKKV